MACVDEHRAYEICGMITQMIFAEQTMNLQSRPLFLKPAEFADVLASMLATMRYLLETIREMVQLPKVNLASF